MMMKWYSIEVMEKEADTLADFLRGIGVYFERSAVGGLRHFEIKCLPSIADVIDDFLYNY